jgi:hemerythrin-like domain-containing protein
MSTARSLLETPTASFEQPFEMLEACHERVHRMLTLLTRLREHVARVGCDTQAQQAARDVMRYFDQAAPQHHLDEELHVFPPLLARASPEVQGVVQRLHQDHLDMEALWKDARVVLGLLAEGRVGRFEPGDEAALAAFSSLYDAHIRAEEEIAYPGAQALLDDDARTAMTEDMMRRRGVK